MTARMLFLGMRSACCVLAIANSSCRVPDVPDGDATKPSSQNLFLGAATRGDVISYQTDRDTQSYTWVNETTGLSGSGTFAPLSGNEYVRGFFEATEDGRTYYVLKLAEDILITNNPSGHEKNKLAMAIKVGTPIEEKTLAGDYLYVWMNDDNTELEWGTARINSGDTFTYRSYAGVRPEDAGELVFDGTGVGTWALTVDDSGNPTGVEFVVGDTTRTGMVLPDRAFILDQGEGNGIWIGVRLPETHVGVPEVTGVYQYMELDYGDPTAPEVALGMYRVNEDSTVDLVSLLEEDPTTPSSWSLQEGLPLTSVDNVNNMFKVTIATEEADLEVYAVVLPGQVVMHFDFADGQFTGYGVGVAQETAD